jgi:hypothetical protein
MEIVFRSGLASLEPGAAMLADDLLAEVLDANLQIAATRRAFLHKVRATWHTVSPTTGDTSPDWVQAMGTQYMRCGVGNQ